MSNRKKEIYIFGHKNPDTDSICAAIAYAYLKNSIVKDIMKNGDRTKFGVYGLEETASEDAVYVPRRAGQLNPETEYVLNRFSFPSPAYINDVRPQVADIDIRKVKGVNRDLSLKQAWSIMRSVNIATLPVLDSKGKLEGLITTGDIAKVYMAVFDNTLLSEAGTPYHNVLDALDAQVVVGDETARITEGRVVIGAANMDALKKHIGVSDMVILGNRYEAQLCAIENKASSIIVCEGAPVSRTIRKLAENNGCVVISTPHDTYTVARLINQSVPIGHFMRKEGLITFKKTDFISDIKAVMTKKRHRDFPVLTKDRKFIGMISRRSLLDLPRKRVILVDHNEGDQAVDGIADASILEIIDHHKLSTVETLGPVIVRNQPVGCTSTIIYQIFIENDIALPQGIAGILCAAILSDTLMYRSPTCTTIDRISAEALANQAGISTQELAEEMFKAGSNLKDKSEEEIFYQDFKKFSANGVTFGVGQIMSMTKDELEELKIRMTPYMQKAKTNHGVDMVFFMLTNILEESTLLLFAGKNAAETAQESFGIEPQADSIFLPGTVSRKKQLIPPIMATLQR